MMAAIPVSEEKHCCWNFWLVFTLACLKAHFGPSPIPRVPFSAIHAIPTHFTDAHPCQAVLNVLVTSCPLSATTRTSGDAPTNCLSCVELLNSCSEVMILRARVTHCWHLAATVKSKHWVYLRAKRSKELLSVKTNKRLRNE